MLAYVACLQAAGRAPRRHLAIVFAFMSGLCLSLAELTRPFVFVLIPALLVCTFIALRTLRRWGLAAFLVPVLLLSGSWHVHQYLRHGQVLWTNHSGFNLVRGWTMVKHPRLEREPRRAVPHRQRIEGRRPNINTELHAKNSRLLKTAVAEYAVEHPLQSIRHALTRLVTFGYVVQTKIYKHEPQHPVLALYRPSVWLGTTCFGVATLVLVVALFRRKGERVALIGSPTTIVVIVGLFTAAVLGVGEGLQERARFLLSVLPFLACLPCFGMPWFGRETDRS
jgi:4-amino-4-deoxy-L-arabinose transferase-like glycosyltransferase